MKMEIQVIPLSEIGLSLERMTSKYKLEKLELPPEGKTAELISGSPTESAEKLAQILKNSGVF
jgi:electron transfer flavoprotein alpha/beta subunit